MEDQRLEYERLIAPIEERMMCAVWRILRNRDDAEDAFQEALLAIWRHWDRIRTHANPHALVLRMCIHSAHDMLRRRARDRKRKDSDAVPEQLPDAGISVVQALSDAEQSAQILRAIGHLPAKQAQAIVMHAIEKIPYSDIAQAMHCGEASARKHAARARSRLRTLLSHLSPTQKEEKVHA